MAGSTLIIGAGVVAHVAAHKAAQNNDILGDICIASRTIARCDRIIEGIHRKNNVKDKEKRLYSRTIDALNIPALVSLIQDAGAEIVINAGSPFVNLSVLQACIEAGVAYVDTAVHEEPDQVNIPAPWYANEWKYSDVCQEKGITAILSAGFDPGIVNSYCAYAQKHLFDEIGSIDILDVNAGNHGRFFATNFDPEINLREIAEEVIYWDKGEWQYARGHSIKKLFDFPVVGRQPVYLMGHDEIHSLARFIHCDTIRFWMGFSDHYIRCFEVLNKIGLLSEKPVVLDNGESVVPLKVVKACLPEPNSLAENYTGKTCIGSLVRGRSGGHEKSVFIYNICDHERCYEEVESQAISYTAGLPPVAAAILIAQGIWDVKRMANVEELDPDPFLQRCSTMGLSMEIMEDPGRLSE